MSNPEPPEPIQTSPGEMSFVPEPQASPEPPARRVRLKRIELQGIGEWFGALRNAILNGLMLVSLVAVIGFAIAELRRDVVVIDPIRLPDTLRDMGYSEDVAADRLWDAMGRINDRTPTAKSRVGLQPASQKIDFEPPGSGIALQEVVQILRRFLRLQETRIVGEITCMTTECRPAELALRLRIFRGDGNKSEPLEILAKPATGGQANDAPSGALTYEAEIDRYFQAGAIELLREIEPYVVAFYLYQTDTDKMAAKQEALRLVAPAHPDRKWALNLLGFVAADDGDYDGAIHWYQRAIAANEKDKASISLYQRVIGTDEEDEFAARAYTNWGNALGAKSQLAAANHKPDDAKEELDEAIKKFKRATELDSKNPFAYISWGNALNDKGEQNKAIDMYTLATKLDSENAVAYTYWGRVLRSKGSLAEAEEELDEAKSALDKAIEKFTLATEIDPDYAVAYNEWGLALDKKGKRDEAIEKFTRATELEPNYAAAYNNWGIALRKKGKLDEAIGKFTRATELDPKYAAGIKQIALDFRRLSKSDEPADARQRYAADAADTFELYLELVGEPVDVIWIRRNIKKLRDVAMNN